MQRIIKAAVDRGASDIHIKAGDVFRARIDGELVPLTRQALTPEQTRAIALDLIRNEEDRKRIDTITDYDCGWGAQGIGRFRVNILRQRGSFAIVMRVIPFDVPSVESLKLPKVLTKIAQAERGMVLVTGVTGSGKSTTMAALVNYINTTENRHIITLENPIEFLHRDAKSSITQREIGQDTESFKMGLRAALRQDPDVIMIGEMRDAETIDTSIKAAETGHLLVSTLHTPDAISTIMRIMAMFPPQEQEIVRIRLAESLHAVVSQRLLTKADGKGRIAAAEIMVVTPTIRDLIVEGNFNSIRDYIAEGREQYGMQTFDQHLTELVLSGDVSYEVAHANASKPSDFELQMRTFGGMSKKAGQGAGAGTNGGARPAAAQAETAPADNGFGTGLDFLNP